MRPVAVLLLGALLAAVPAAAQKSKARAGKRPAVRPTPAKTLGSAPKRPADGSQSRFVGEPISLDVKDADLRDVLHTFAELTKLNIAIDPEVKGSVTVRLHDVPWDQALDTIVRSNGFGYVLEGNVMRVGTVQRLTQQP